MKTTMANSIDLTAGRQQYDQQSKKLLSNKPILAVILKHTVRELEGMNTDEIIECIEGEPVISEVGILEGTDKIAGGNIEDSSIYEGTIYYDIRFSLIITEDNRKKILFDIEAQKEYNPGYEIVTRGIVYCARMISSQIETEFTLTDYDGLKKVYSIWLCFNPPKYIGNAISSYTVRKQDILPGIPDNPAAYDKLTVVQICLDETSGNQNELTNMLNTIFSKRKKAAEIKAELSSEYGIPMDDGLAKEVDSMCNLSGMFLEEGERKGLEKGELIGLEKGEIIGKILAYHECGITEEQIAAKLNITVGYVRQVLEEKFVCV